MSKDYRNQAGVRMAYVEAATFKMGGGDPVKCPDGLPVHNVTITKPY